MPARKSQRVERGVRVDSGSLQAYVWVAGRLQTKRFPLDTPITTIRRWREDQRVGHRLGVSPTDTTTFAEDAATYLALVRSMPTYQDRAYRIQQWVHVFGTQPRRTITAPAIRAVLEQWRHTGRIDGQGLSAGSLNTRRTALLHLWTVLDGKGAPNPVKDVPPYLEATDEPVRALPWQTWYRVLVLMGRGAHRRRRGFRHWQGRRERTKTQARLRVMLWTGWPHAQLMRLQPDDIDWTHGRARLTARRKGRGAPGRWLPLLPPAVRALAQFDALKAWGPFSQSAMHSALQRAVRAANRRRGTRPVIPHLRPYDARHSFGTMLALATTDDRAVQDLMLHATARQTRRYTTGATLTRLEQAVAEMAGKVGKVSLPLRAPDGPSARRTQRARVRQKSPKQAE